MINNTGSFVRSYTIYMRQILQFKMELLSIKLSIYFIALKIYVDFYRSINKKNDNIGWLYSISNLGSTGIVFKYIESTTK